VPVRVMEMSLRDSGPLAADRRRAVDGEGGVI
jgi:hypothetical protein